MSGYDVNGETFVSRGFLVSVVDDDESFRRALVVSLVAFGFDTIGYSSAEEFIAGDSCCDCVVADVQMPGISGLELLRRIKISGSKLPVIIVTGRFESGIEAKAVAGGAVCFLMKPFEIDALISCLDRALAM